MKKKRGFNLKKEYIESWRFIKESKNFIYVAIGIFIAFFILAFFVHPPEVLLNYIVEFIQELLEKTQGMSAAELIGFIFLNNFQSSFFGMIFGIALGIFPVLALITNGYILGFVSSLTVAEYGVLSLWRLLPHGIFELPAIFISLGLGLKIGGSFLYNFLKYYFPDISRFNLWILGLLSLILFPITFLIILILFFVNEGLRKLLLKNISFNFKNSLKTFLFIIIPLLIIAGIIEGILISLL